MNCTTFTNARPSDDQLASRNGHVPAQAPQAPSPDQSDGKRSERVGDPIEVRRDAGGAAEPPSRKLSSNDEIDTRFGTSPASTEQSSDRSAEGSATANCQTDASYQSPHAHAASTGPRTNSVEMDNSLLSSLARHLDESRELTDQQEKAIELMLSGVKDHDIAQQLGIHRTTLWRWRQRDEDFRRSLSRARERAFRKSTERLRELVPKALEVLESQLSEENYQAATRILQLARFGQETARPTLGDVDGLLRACIGK